MPRDGRELAKLASPSPLVNPPSRSHVSHKSSSSEAEVRSMTTSSIHVQQLVRKNQPVHPAPLRGYPRALAVERGCLTLLATTQLPSVTKQLSGLPTGLDAPTFNISGLPERTSPLDRLSPQSKMVTSTSLLPLKKDAYRHSSVSPTPRKRHTVALGGPIVDPETLHLPLNSPTPVRCSTRPRRMRRVTITKKKRFKSLPDVASTMADPQDPSPKKFPMNRLE